MDPSKPSYSNHHTDKYATGSKRPNNHAEDESVMVSVDEESYTEEVPIQDIDLTDDVSDGDSETSHISIPSSSEATTVDLCDLYNEKTSDTESASDMRPTSEKTMEKTNEEIVEKVEQFMVSEGFLAAGTVNRQAIIRELPNINICKIPANEYMVLDKICEVYKCDKFLPFVTFSQKTFKKESKEKCSLSEEGCKQGEKLVDDSNLEREVPLTAGTSSEQKNRKEGVIGETSTQRIHKESTADDNLNNSKEKNIQECMNPTQGPMCSSNKSLSVDSKATANRDFGKSGNTIPVLPKTVTSNKKLVSKEQTQPIKKQINTAMRTSSDEPSLDDANKTNVIIVLDESGDTISVLPKPVTSTTKEQTRPIKKQINTAIMTNTQTIVSKKQTQPVKKQVTTAKRTSKGPLCSSHEPILVDTKAGANSVVGKSGKGTRVLANTQALATQVEKKNISTNTPAGPIHQAKTHFTNTINEVIDLTREGDFPIVEAVSGTSPVAIDTALVEKYQRQSLASEINPNPALTNPVKNTIIPAGSSTSTSVYVAPHSKTLMKESEVGGATMHTLPATIPTQRPQCSHCKLLSPDAKASANNVLHKSTSVLPQPVTNTTTSVSKEQNQPIKKKINTEMRSSQGPLHSSYEPTLVDTKANANSVLGKSGEGNRVLANTQALVTHIEKKNISTTTLAGPIHQAQTHFTNYLTRDGSLKAVDKTMIGKYKIQIPASENKPAFTNPVKNMTTPAESHAGNSTDMASNSKIVKETRNIGVSTPCVLPGKRKRPVFTFSDPIIVGPPPSLTPDTHSNVINRTEGNQMSRTPRRMIFCTPGNPHKNK